MSEVRFGFIGAGFIATKAVGPAVHKGVGTSLHAAAASDPARARTLEPSDSVYTTYDAVLEDPMVDVVYISLTNDQHLPWILRALKAGKHVLCEKPLCLTAEGAEVAYTVASECDRLLVEANWYRWHPRTVRAAFLVDAGSLGQIEQVDGRFTFGGVPSGNYRLDPQRGGGALYDVACYPVSAIQWAMPFPIQVSSASFVMGPTGVDLAVAAELRGESARATVAAGIDHPEHQQLTVSGTEAIVRFCGQAFTSWQSGSELEIASGSTVTRETFPPVDAYQLMVESVARRIRGDDGWVIPAHESVAVAATLDDIRAQAVHLTRDHEEIRDRTP